jgi:formylglycine-generating enzyme required for sulfatase activity
MRRPVPHHSFRVAAMFLGAAVLLVAPAARAADPAPAAAKASAARKNDMIVVPAGEFFMGCNDQADSECLPDEVPGKFVRLPAFAIDRTEVTVAQYAKCVAAGKCSASGLDQPFHDGKVQKEYAEFCNWKQKGREQHPINCVDWSQAAAYCKWAGKRLPTEAEWERTARGTDGRRYAWGNEHPVNVKLTNIADETARKRFPAWKNTLLYDDGYVGTAPVGSFPDGATPVGALDVIGNVWEWNADQRETGRVVRGASWMFEPAWVRTSLRGWTDAKVRAADGGFRCARDAKPGEAPPAATQAPVAAATAVAEPAAPTPTVDATPAATPAPPTASTPALTPRR